MVDVAVQGWAVVAGGLLLWFGLQRWRLARRLGGRRVVCDHPAVGEVTALRQVADVRFPVVLTASGRLSSPIAVGLSEISVPEKALTDLGTDERRSMLAHELAHLIRRDPVWLAVAGLIERTFFFQPLNRLARRRMQSAAEVLCDRWAADRIGTPVTLAACLVKVAEWIDAAPRPIPVAGMAEERSELVDRVRRLVEEEPMESPFRRRWVIGLSVVGLAAVIAFAPTVSFVRAAVSQQPPVSDVPNPTNPVRAQAQTDQRSSRRAQEPRDTSAVVPALIAALKDENASVRRAAAQSLGNWGDRRATEALVTLLDDDDSEVRGAVIQALGELRDPRSASALAAKVSDPNKEIRRVAVYALKEMREVNASVFRPALADSDADTRQAAIDALAERKDRASASAVAALVSDRDADVRQTALHALAEFEDRGTIDAITRALADRDADVRQAALHALGQFELSTLPDGVLAALEDGDADVRQAAASLAGDAEDTRAVPMLKRLLGDADADVREAAVHALASIRNDAAIDALVASLKSSDPVVRRSAAEALGRKDH